MRPTLFILILALCTGAIGGLGCEQKAPAEAESASADLEPRVAESVEMMNKAEEAGARVRGEVPTSQPSVAAEGEAEGQAGAEAAGEAKKQGALPDPIAPGETKLYGDRFTVIEPAVSLATAIEQIDANAGKPVKIEARIDKVCKAKGCWFTLAADDVDRPVRVKMKDYGFFVPRNSDGTAVVVEGALTKRTMPTDEVQHYADDAAKAGEAPAKVEGPQDVYEFTATTVEITHS